MKIVYRYAQIISTTCNGSRNSNSQREKPSRAFSFWYMNRLAGKIAMSNAMIPIAAYEETEGMHNKIPSKISAPPLKAFNNLGLGRFGGMIFKYNPGFRKWLIPARM